MRELDFLQESRHNKPNNTFMTLGDNGVLSSPLL